MIIRVLMTVGQRKRQSNERSSLLAKNRIKLNEKHGEPALHVTVSRLSRRSDGSRFEV